MSPSIPYTECFFCGTKTNETQSVFGVGHTECFKKARLNPPVLPRELGPMDHFYHSHPINGVKGIRTLTHYHFGCPTYFLYLPDQTV